LEPGLNLDIKALPASAPPNGFNFEADILELLAIENQSAVKNKGWLVHVGIYLGVIEILNTEFVPLGCNHNSIRSCSRLVRRVADCNPLLYVRNVADNSRFGEVEPDLRLFDLWIVDSDICRFSNEILRQCDGRRLASISGVLLECKSKERNLLVCKSVE